MGRFSGRDWNQGLGSCLCLPVCPSLRPSAWTTCQALSVPVGPSVSPGALFCIPVSSCSLQAHLPERAEGQAATTFQNSELSGFWDTSGMCRAPARSQRLALPSARRLGRSSGPFFNKNTVYQTVPSRVLKPSRFAFVLEHSASECLSLPPG